MVSTLMLILLCYTTMMMAVSSPNFFAFDSHIEVILKAAGTDSASTPSSRQSSPFISDSAKQLLDSLILKAQSIWNFLCESMWRNRYFKFLNMSRSYRRKFKGALNCSLSEHEQCLVRAACCSMWLCKIKLQNDVELNPGPEFKKGDLVYAYTKRAFSARLARQNHLF
jgi:hypothetical protein